MTLITHILSVFIMILIPSFVHLGQKIFMPYPDVNLNKKRILIDLANNMNNGQDKNWKKIDKKEILDYDKQNRYLNIAIGILILIIKYKFKSNIWGINIGAIILILQGVVPEIYLLDEKPRFLVMGLIICSIIYALSNYFK